MDTEVMSLMVREQPNLSFNISTRLFLLPTYNRVLPAPIVKYNWTSDVINLKTNSFCFQHCLNMTLTAETSSKVLFAWHIYESKIKNFHDGRNKTSLCMFPWCWSCPPSRTITVILHCPRHCHAAALMLHTLIWSLVCRPQNNHHRTCCTTNWHHCGCLNRDQCYVFPISKC